MDAIILLTLIGSIVVLLLMRPQSSAPIIISLPEIPEQRQMGCWPTLLVLFIGILLLGLLART